ncbi:MAG: aminopeptidase P family protein [Paracoccaceae bacterium]
MYQEFTVVTSPETGAARLEKLRKALRNANVSGFLIPRGDAHQGENVAPCFERLAWLTGFTGSAGMCAALLDTAGVFADGRYTLQVRAQIDLAAFTPIPSREIRLEDWLRTNLPNGGVIAYDAWLHSYDEIKKLTKELSNDGITFQKTTNFVDQIWEDQPAPPKGLISPYPIEFTGETSESKRNRLAAELQKQALSAVVLTLLDSIAWLLNIRGSDIQNIPVALCFAVLRDDGHVDIFADPDKCDDALRAHFGQGVQVHSEADFLPYLAKLSGQVGVDRECAPVMISDKLQNPTWFSDPCVLPKACKNPTEIAGSRAAHIRDGVAMVEFLCWLEVAAKTQELTEIGVAKKLEMFRRNANTLREISFDTICGSGPNGAIVHYRVNEDSNRTIQQNEVLLIDSGGQYLDGTTDITRTVAIGDIDAEIKRANTLVLKGMIAITKARWPQKVRGGDLDAFARNALWQAGFDYEHGTGHGVGVYLGVHEGPQAISPKNTTELLSGMIISNEPGHYKEGVYGIRIENLLVIHEANIPDGGNRPMLGFETLTFVPIDRNLILPDMLDRAELEWLNVYHAEVLAKLKDMVSDAVRPWLEKACAAL